VDFGRVHVGADWLEEVHGGEEEGHGDHGEAVHRGLAHGALKGAAKKNSSRTETTRAVSGTCHCQPSVFQVGAQAAYACEIEDGGHDEQHDQRGEESLPMCPQPRRSRLRPRS